MSEPTQAVPVCYRHPDRETYIRCQRCDKPICPDCMNSASVGFQCPSCVKEGSKSVRQARLPYGGIRVSNPTLVTSILLGLNVSVWLAITASGGGDSAIAAKLAIIPDWTLRQLSGDDSFTLVDGVAHGAWWQVVTAGFTHIWAIHLLMNMLALWQIGPVLEQLLGRSRFLALYLISGITSSAAVMLFSNENGLTVGASGSMFGLLGAMLVIAHKTRGNYQEVLQLLGINLVITFLVPLISWQGHLGGLIGGILVAAVMVYAPRRSRGLVQFGASALILVAAVALIGLRAQDLRDNNTYPVASSRVEQAPPGAGPRSV